MSVERLIQENFGQKESTVNDMKSNAKEKAEQLMRRKRLLDNREKEIKRKIDTSRSIIIGKIFTEAFRGVLHYQPKLKAADTNAEFADLKDFITTIAKDQKYSGKFQEIIDRKLAGQQCESIKGSEG